MAAGNAGRITDPDSFHLYLVLVRDCDGETTTLEGQPSYFNPFIGPLGLSNEVLLKTVTNYSDTSGSAPFTQEVPTPGGQDDCSFIENLKRAAKAYKPVPYSFPSPRTGDLSRWEYNSNSWVSGIMAAAGAPAPGLGSGGKFKAPGYESPVTVPGFPNAGKGQDCCCKK